MADATTLPTVGESKPRQIRMTDEFWDAVQAKANEQSTDAGKVVRRLLGGWLNPPELTAKQQTQYDKGVADGRAQILAELQALVDRESADDA